LRKYGFIIWRKSVQWYNEPPTWNEQDKTITVTSAPKTDFWRKTHSGAINDNGHFYYQSVTGDFIAEVKISGGYNALYDQAGLMVRADDSNWLKCGIEYLEGVQYASAVVTRDYSDWSVVTLPQSPPALWLRVTRHGITLEVHFSVDGAQYTMLRQAYLIENPTLNIGIMCASPTGSGFTATFEGFTVRGM
jgi:regulation of enolase protein 1 (concanavalin A-like superfamily)